MILYQFRHPKSIEFLASAGFISSDTVAPLPDLTTFLSRWISPSADDQNYLLVPIILEILSAFYPAQDTQFTLNEFISIQFPEKNEVSHQNLLRYLICSCYFRFEPVF